MLGGDYTLGYLKQHDYGNALRTLAKSYYFFWTYRPLNSPVVKESDRVLFADEEAKFGDVRPSAPQSDDASAVESYKARLIVPEPDRFILTAPGKGLLPAILSIPQLALMKALGIGSDRLLTAQFHQQYDFAFTFCRLAQILAGIVSVILVFKILERYVNLERAYLGTLIFAIFPVTIKYFPNIHHDLILVPFFVLAVYLYVTNRYVAAGVAYGLALASKNVAIILVPVLGVDLLIRLFQVLNKSGPAGAFVFARARMFGLAIMGAVAFVTLLPFANPVSYAEEILTPVIARPLDPRGENVSQWSLKSIVGNDASHELTLSGQVKFAQNFLYFHDMGFMFFVIALCLAFQRRMNDITRISVLVMLFYLAVSPIFGLALEYRTLFVVPFFAMAAAELLEVRQLKWLVAATGVLAVLYVSNPAETDHIHASQIQDRQPTPP